MGNQTLRLGHRPIIQFLWRPLFMDEVSLCLNSYSKGTCEILREF